MSDLSALRSGRKGAITKHLSALDRLVCERDSIKVKERLETLKVAFANLEDAHNQYHESLTDQVEIISSDEWFLDIEHKYACGIKAAHMWLDGLNEGSTAPDTKCVSDVSKADFVSLLGVPQLHIDIFKGDPLDYQNFIAVFDEAVHLKPIDDSQKLARLLQFTDGPAKAAIKTCSLIGGSKGYLQARNILHSRFGNDHLISRKIIADLESGKAVITAAQMQQLADNLSTAATALDSLNMLPEVDNQPTIMRILNRCPGDVQTQWYKIALAFKNDFGRYPNFMDFVKFISKCAQDWSDPVYGKESLRLLKNTKSASCHGVCNDVTFDSNNDVPRYTQARHIDQMPRSCVICKDQVHKLFQCDKFKAMSVADRFQVVKTNRVCFNCLLPNHIAKNCKRRSMCSINGCSKRHSKFLHVMNNRSGTGNVTECNHSDTGANNAQRAKSNDHIQRAQSSATSAFGSTVYLPTVSVLVNGKRACAMLDPGSTNTFITKDLASNLNLHGRPHDYLLNTVNGVSAINSNVVSFNVSSLDGSFSQSATNVLVISSIPGKYPERRVDISQYPHLADLDLSPVPEGAPIDLLIGQDNPHMLLQYDIRFNPANPNDLYATKSVFGWCLNGLIGHSNQNRIISNFVQMNQLYEHFQCDGSDDIDVLGHSIEDLKVLALWDKELKLVDGHYELPIPWRNGRPVMPNNRALAKYRLTNLIKRLDKQGLADVYDNNIKVLLENGYAEPVPSNELSLSNDTVWYLPHHPVLKKPGKVRTVFDCAAKYKGISLNSQCFRGPDLVNKLIGVLLRFRQYRYAVTADIECMYLQVKIPERDRNALRFLWYAADNELIEYRMSSHLFGSVWSGSSSAYALRRTATDNPCSPLVTDTIMNNFYVDDMLKSVCSLNEAIEVIHDTKKVLSCGGFNLTKYTVNDNTLLQEIDHKDRAGDIKAIAPDTFCKTLGMQWEVSSDSFSYKPKVIDMSGPVTRRRMLSYTSSLYDPLGLIAPVIIVGKVLFQEATRLGLGWDDPVSPSLESKWQAWIGSLSQLEHMQFKRCVVPEGFENSVFELHHFCDASSTSYGACTYVRAVSPEGRIHVSLLAAKGRLAPLKTMTIPRLELSAAVLATKLDVLVRRHINLHSVDSMFWCDSQIVLAYLKNESKRFHVFVANRISQIRQVCDPSQWAHISGRANPADVLSRGSTPNGLPESWFVGPSFLCDYKSSWPVPGSIPADIFVHDPEVKSNTEVNLVAEVKSTSHVNSSSAATSSGSDAEVHGLEALINHYSSFRRLKKAICWFRRFLQYLQGAQVTCGFVTYPEMEWAETQLIRFVQGVVYSKELCELQRSGSVSISSSLSKLSPKLEGGLIVVGGRLHEAPIHQRVKCPVILPHNHKLSHMIVHEVHGHAHLGIEWVFTYLRQKYWITKVRPLIKKIKHSCVTCKKLYASAMSQKMANLPADRCEPFNPPFTVTGLDVFGPFYVAVGRARVKRYGCVYSCFSTRAIHIEKLDDMTTDSFINAFIRFTARRGEVKRVLSDNGTNIVGARNELTQAFRRLDRIAIAGEARKRNIDWQFNPPLASHHGGVYERMIRTIRRVMVAILPSHIRLTDDILSTVFCECENIINSRPLTKCSDDPNDSDPLTPNHFLVMRGNYALPWTDVKSDNASIRRWKYAQMLVDNFWKRWLREYLPFLNQRPKWLQTKPNLQVGDLVLVMDVIAPRGSWPLGRVEEVVLGRDNLVRSARIVTKNSRFLRPITKLISLEGMNE